LRPWPLKIVIDRVIGGKETRVPLVGDWLNSPDVSPESILLVACAATLSIAIGTGFFTYLFTRIMGNVTQKLIFNLRSTVFSRLQRLSLRYHSANRLGDTMSRLTTDINAIQMLLARGSLMFFSNVFLMLAMLTMMLWLNWKFTLIACSVAPLLFLAVWKLTNKIKTSSRRARDHDGELASMAQESLSAIHMVKGMAQEKSQDTKFSTQSQLSLNEYLGRVKLQAWMAPIVDILAAAGLALVMYFGAKAVLDKTMTVGDVIVFFAYVTNFYSPMRAMARQAGGFAKASAGAERVAEVLQSELDVEEAADAIEAPAFTGAVDFKNVSFQYDDHPVLRDLSLSIQPGESIAIVGPTGAGKSTLASLLLRLYDPVEGSVNIDSMDIRKFKTDSMRKQIGIVLQESVLLKGSLRDNIMFGCPGSSEAEVQNAAKLALVDEFASKFSKGLSHDVSERGSSLSGGQRQRISIARAILRDTPILLLDEPTSSLDVQSEAVVLQALKAASANRTTIMITHRLTAAQMVDRIIVLEDGRIVEQGTYAELIDANGAFSRLAASDDGKPVG
jgi:subfamily B ATP-binding cassette protein MsbA